MARRGRHSPNLALRRLALAVYAVAVAAVLLAPASVTAPTDPVRSLPFADKLVHVALFAGAAALSRWAFPSAASVTVFAAAVAFGALTELAQGAVPGRSPDVWDAAADAAGAGAALLLAAWWTGRQH